jgi:signal peptidase I
MALLVYSVFSHVFLLAVATGADMYPAILDGDVLLCYRLEPEYRKDDVVVAQVDGATVIGRVVARGGDSVNITAEGSLFVNGTEQRGEIAFYTYPEGASYPLVVPEDCVYLLGDNRSNTVDSRSFGPVPLGDVQAKVVSLFRKRGI